MKKLLLPVICLALLGNFNPAQARECSGSTEEMLECYSPEVKQLLADWVKSWSEGDIESYLQLYAANRSPRSGMSRSAWEDNRRARVKPGRDIQINLRLESMGMEDSGLFDVVFDQHYKAANYEDMVKKRLFLIHEGDQLKIWKEDVLP